MKELKVAPLSGGYMITSMAGFLVSAYFVLPRSASWGAAFLLFFALMFVASLISMTYAPTDSQLKLK